MAPCLTDASLIRHSDHIHSFNTTQKNTQAFAPSGSPIRHPEGPETLIYACSLASATPL